jgi:mediator of RNA polymerase II transcription subunit 14
MELKVNEALATEGLLGCYKYLHEFTLTAKVGEFARQAVELSTARWVDTLKIERLDRALSIQYWLNRPHSQGTKSWIILGVNSGKGLDGGHGQTPPSHLTLRWFRDGKEVKDIEIQFDTESISTENLLTTVVNRHIEYLLSSMHNKLLSKPRFTRQQARLALKITEGEDVNSSLTMQLLDEEDVTVQVEPLTGTFVLLPRSAVVLDGQRKFNSMANPAEDGPSGLEQLRWIYTMKDLHTRSKTVGWAVLLTRPPISGDEVKSIVYSATPSSREPFQAVWMRIPEWDSRWFVMMSMSLGGDNWWLIEL